MWWTMQAITEALPVLGVAARWKHFFAVKGLILFSWRGGVAGVSSEEVVCGGSRLRWGWRSVFSCDSPMLCSSSPLICVMGIRDGFVDSCC